MEFDTERVAESSNEGVVVDPHAPVPLADVDAVAARIRKRLSDTIENIIAIGDDLISVKERLRHGDFRTWVEAKCNMSHSIANKMMQVARRFGDGKFVTVTNLELSVMYSLAAPSTPDEVVEKVLQQAEDGKTISRKTIAEMKHEFVDPAQNERTSHQAAAEKTVDPEPIGLAKITTADLVAELERRAAGEGRDDVRHLLAPLLDPFYIPDNLNRHGESAGAIGSRGNGS